MQLDNRTSVQRLTEWFLNIPCLAALAVNLQAWKPMKLDLTPGVESVVAVRGGVLVRVEPPVLTGWRQGMVTGLTCS